MAVLERIFPLLDDIHYWTRGRYKSDRQNEVIIEADTDSAEKI